ncbi:MAG: hypothetical protein DRJ03_07260 [Chloroflexi bacterium]|nr:MAG: hypothetical protein DRJ03_07260 [Chloroflexota bacterium]
MGMADWNIFGSGMWQLVSGAAVSGSYVLELYSPAAGQHIELLYNGNTSIGNTEVIAWVKTYSGNPGRPTLYWREQSATDTLNGYAMMIPSATTATIYRVAGGVWTAMATITVPSIQGQWQKFRVRMKSYNIEVSYWDGAQWVLLALFHDTAQQWASGAAGFGNRTQGKSWFDDVEIGVET